MPTNFTRLAGIAAIVSAVLWAASAAMWLVDHFLDPSGTAGVAVATLMFWFVMGWGLLLVTVRYRMVGCLGVYRTR